MIKNNEDFAREIAKKYGITIFVARQVIDSPFRFIKNRMVEGNYEGLMLPYFGKMIVKPGVREFLRKRNENKEEGKGS